MNEKQLEEMIKEVLSSMTNNESKSRQSETPKDKVSKLTTEDYPLQDKHPDRIRTPTNKTLEDITMDAVVNNTITPMDIRVSPDTLELQAEVAESAGRRAFAGNLRRAAELTLMEDDKVLDIYNALRPNRSTKEELLALANEIEQQYDAKINAAFIREAALVYEERDILRVD